MVEKKKEDSMLFKVKESGDKSDDCEQDLIINTDGPHSVRINRSQSALPPCLLHLLPLMAYKAQVKHFLASELTKDPYGNWLGLPDIFHSVSPK